MNTLSIRIDNEDVATLSHYEGEFALTYNSAWSAAGGYPISPHLPFAEISRGAAVNNFFSNLLPEGEMLSGLSLQHQVSKFDVFGLLKKVGRDCAGAMVIAESEQTEEQDPDGYTLTSDEELNQQIIDSRRANVSLMYWGRKPRMSLAGVQNKLGVYLDTDESVYLPLQSQPTSHILKIGDPRYPGQAANEYFCMQLAEAVGLSVPATLFRKLPEPVLLVHRYDREWTSDAHTIRRRHQIDACQALNLPPNLKYEMPDYEYAPTGATLADIVGLARLCDTPSSAQFAILNWILFNYLIGNTDGHAKNISFLVSRASNAARSMGRNASIAVAPVYDLVCGTVYGLNDFAQCIGNETDPYLISSGDWRDFAKQTGIAPQFLKRVGEMLLKNISAKLDGVVDTTTAITSTESVRAIGACVHAQGERLTDSLATL